MKFDWTRLKEFFGTFREQNATMSWPEPRNTGMLYRRVGRSGLHVSILGLGGWLTYVIGLRI